MSAAPAPTIILSAPQGWGKTRQKAALQVEFNCRHVIDNWHPRMGTCPGALHLTSMHPGDLEDFGIAPEDIHRRGWPCARDLHRPRRVPSAQAGNIAPALLALFGPLLLVALIGFALGASHHLDGFTISDHSTEVQIAQDMEQAQRDEQRRERLHTIYRAICGNGEWEELGGNAIRCLPRRGLPAHIAQLPEGRP